LIIKQKLDEDGRISDLSFSLWLYKCLSSDGILSSASSESRIFRNAHVETKELVGSQ
jgi:hypothetical protein